MDNELDNIIFYLTGAKPVEDLSVNYKQLTHQHPTELNQQGQQLWFKMNHHPFYMRFIDGYLALTQPYHPVRKKIYLGLTLIEATPAYAHLFLPKKYNLFSFIQLGLKGCRAVGSALLGYFIVNKIRKQWP